MGKTVCCVLSLLGRYYLGCLKEKDLQHRVELHGRKAVLRFS